MTRPRQKQPYDKQKDKSGNFKILIYCRMKQHEKCPGVFEYKSGLKKYPICKRTCRCACHGKTFRKKYY